MRCSPAQHVPYAVGADDGGDAEAVGLRQQHYALGSAVTSGRHTHVFDDVI
jgi:hypothetical protein